MVSEKEENPNGVSKTTHYESRQSIAAKEYKKSYADSETSDCESEHSKNAKQEISNVDSETTDCESGHGIDASSTTRITTPLPCEAGVDNASPLSSSYLIKARDWFRRIFILELPVFLIYVAINISGTVYQNQLLYYSCTNVYHHSDEECKPLWGIEKITDASKDLENQVQPYAARILMVKSLIEGIIPAILSLFIGPWSDKFGRRFILLASCTGYLIHYIVLAIISGVATATAVSPWIFVLSSVPSVLCGGTCVLITIVYCYISDVAKEKTVIRMLLFDSAMGAGVGIGSVLGGYLYAGSSAVVVFIVAALLILVSLLYMIFIVPESLRPEQIQTGSRIREFFHWDLVVELVKVSIKKRPNCDRAIIWLTITALTLQQFTSNGDSNVTYLFFVKKFRWTLQDYSTYTAVYVGVQVVGCVLGIILLRRMLRMSVITMTMIALACSVMQSTVSACAAYAWELYLGLGLGCLSGIMTPMALAILAIVVPNAEVGKVFALTTSLETISPLIAAPLYTSVYNATLSFYPGLFNIISAALNLLNFTLVAIIYFIRRSFAHTNIYKALGRYQKPIEQQS